MNIFELDKEYVMNSYARYPVALSRGKGSLVYDTENREYIDLAAGIAVNTFGFCDEAWISAVSSQLSSLAHVSNLYYTRPQAELAEMLCEKTGMKKVFFSNSGAEANECAIKAARKYSSGKYSSERNKILTLKNSFHGRTVTTLSATGQEKMHVDFDPFTPGFSYAEANNVSGVIEELSKGDYAAFMFETIQGEGGLFELSEEFVSKTVDFCKEHDILIIVDEVQTGNGRTGSLYSYMNYGFVPDIFTTAKGLCGGLPLGATLFSEKLQTVFVPGSHGSTFGGNPVCAAGALSILQRLDEALFEQVREKGTYVKETLANCKGVKEVCGRGLMLGILTEKPAAEIVSKALEQGVLVITAKDKVRLLPALNIGWAELKKATEIIAEIIAG